MPSNFFAYLARMRLIRRWSLMHSSRPENVEEHSYRVAVIAHALAVIRKRIFNRESNPERAAFLALFHDAGEVITGDLPTPVKHYTAELRDAYKKMEKEAVEKMLTLLPKEIRIEYSHALIQEKADGDMWELVRAADKIDAWIKCIEERRGGNHEFLPAEKKLRAQVEEFQLPEAEYFIREFVPGFSLTLDDLNHEE